MGSVGAAWRCSQQDRLQARTRTLRTPVGAKLAQGKAGDTSFLCVEAPWASWGAATTCAHQLSSSHHSSTPGRLAAVQRLHLYRPSRPHHDCLDPAFLLFLLLCSYMYLGMALHQLSDFDNAAAAYDKAVSLEPAEPLLHLNYGKQTQADLHASAVASLVAPTAEVITLAGLQCKSVLRLLLNSPETCAVTTERASSAMLM